MFKRVGNLSFINQFPKKWYRQLASTASDRKGGKWNMIFHDSNKNYFIFKTSKFKNLDDLSIDFSCLRTSAVSMTSTASITSVASMTFTASIHQIIYWSWWLDQPWHPNDQYQSLFVEWIVKTPIFHWYLIPFCWRLLRPADVTFSWTNHWNSKFPPPWTRYGP